MKIAKLDQQQMDEEVGHSAGRMMNSAVFGQLIILVVYLPIFTLQGIEGKMFKPMAQTVAFALAGAFLLSLTYVPMMSSIFLSRKLNHRKNISDRLMEKTESLFERALKKVLRFPKWAVSGVLILFTVAVFILLSLGGEFIPTLEEGDFAVETRVLTGSNLNTTIASTQKASKILRDRFPEVEKVVTKIGSGEIPTDPMPMEAADMMVILKDKSEWTSAKTFNELAEKMATAIEEVPGVTYGFQYPVQMRFNELMTGAKQDVVCKIFGENLDTLAKYAARMGSIISGVHGAKDLYVEAVTGMPQIVITYNRGVMARYGLSVGDINQVVNSAFAGQISGMVFEGERRFDLVIRLDTMRRQSINDVKNLLIPTSMGTQVPLSHFARVEVQNGPNQVQREDAKRRIIVGFNVRGRDVQSIVDELRLKVDKQISFPPGYYPVYGGAFENLNAAKKRLSIAVPVSLALIFMLLYFAFNSVRQGLLIYSAIPLSAIGGIFALYLRNMPFSISAGVGFIALFGVAVLNGIVLIAEFNRLRHEGVSDPLEIVLRGTRLRLRPVLMTAAVASLGFLPMALSNGAGAEVQRPLATVVIGGLLIATALTLFILPVLYLLFEKKQFKRTAVTNLTLFIFALLIAGNTSLHAQTPVTLQAATDTALKKNLYVKNERLQAEYRKRLVNTGADIPQANISAEYGQINSSYTDNRFSVSQNFAFPAVYSRQKSMLRLQSAEASLKVTLKEAEIRKEVATVFCDILFLGQKRKLLLQSDSIYQEFLKVAEQRFSQGESDVLEKMMAHVQRGDIARQLQQVETDLETLSLKFNITVNPATPLTPEESEIKLSPPLISDTSVLSAHPSLQVLRQQWVSSAMNLRLEKARLLPGFFVAYNNMSMVGTGADNVNYNRSVRFQSAQVGIGVPLFYGSQKAKINGASSGRMIAENIYESGLQSLQLEYDAALSRYRNAVKNLAYFETKTLPDGNVIVATVNRQLSSGAINYLDWATFINQVTALRSNYLDAVRNYNQCVIQLNYLTGK
jgi:cobalt-zinc-cadmium resistance protein CzcA